MTDREFKRLRRRELLEIMFQLRRELDEVRLENEDLKKRLEEKNDPDSETLRLLRKISAQADRLCGDAPGDGEIAGDECFEGCEGCDGDGQNE